MARGLYPDDPEPPARSGRGFTVSPEDRTYRASGADGEDDQPARRGFMRPIVACLVALLCAGALYFVYTKGKQAGAGPGGVPLIRADQGSTKSKPAQAGGEAPDQDGYGQPAAGNAERLLPPPEQPLPRPAPSATPATPVIESPTAPLPTQDVGVAAAPKEAPPTPVSQIATPSPAKPSMLSAPDGAKSVPGVIVPPPPEEKAAPATPGKPAAASAPPKSAPQTAAAGSFRIQIAATKDDPSAHKEWERLQKAHQDLLGNLSPTVVKADLGDKGVFYRIQAGPIADHAQAEKLCTQLKAFSIGCLVVKAQ